MKKINTLISIALASVIFVGCGGDDSSSGGENQTYSKSAMLDNYASLVGALADDFKTKSQTLKASLETYNETNAKANWRAVATSYKKLQPILETDKSNNSSANGYYTVTMSNNIYQPIYTAMDAWRMGKNGRDRDRGIDKLEYILFSPWKVFGEDGASHQHSYTDSEKSSLGAAEADQLIIAADSIKKHWSTSGKLTEIKSTEQTSVFYIANRLFEYIGRLKDEHIGRPAGLIVDAPTKIPSKTESPSSEYSKEEAIALLEGIKNLYKGGTGLGLDDMLIENGYSNNNDKVIAAFDDTMSKLKAIDGSLYDACTNDFADVEAAFKSLQELEKVYNTNINTLMSVTSDMQFTNDGDSTF
ncbi:MAG: hypothetical protein OIF32_05725 [Campylobacterales bacterium]|nr:hypothetical protein [Campylobacterales bacterium]